MSRRRRDPNAPIVVTASTPYPRRVEAFDRKFRAYLQDERRDVDAYMRLFEAVMTATQQGLGLSQGDIERVVRMALLDWSTVEPTLRVESQNRRDGRPKLHELNDGPYSDANTRHCVHCGKAEEEWVSSCSPPECTCHHVAAAHFLRVGRCAIAGCACDAFHRR